VYWDVIQNEVAKFTKVCSYDRLGRGWSTGPIQNNDNDLVVLNELLKASELPAPYILVGHGWGAEYMLRYRFKYPEDVKGVIAYEYDWQKEKNLMEAYRKDQLNMPIIMIASEIAGLSDQQKVEQDYIRELMSFHLDDWQADSAFVLLDDTMQEKRAETIIQAIQLFSDL